MNVNVYNSTAAVSPTSFNYQLKYAEIGTLFQSRVNNAARSQDRITISVRQDDELLALQEEMEQWDVLSDEALKKFENELDQM